jgi:hypothetical protein
VNLILGVGLLLHPFILRLSSILTVEGYNLYAQLLTNGQLTRFGKDSFFLIMAPLLSLTGKEFRVLPKFEFLAMFFLVFITFINQNDFLFPTAFYQSIMILSGASILINLYKKITNKTKSLFFVCLIVQAWIFSGWIFLEKLGVKPYRIYAEALGNVAVKSTHAITHVSGPLGHPNLTGAFLALTIPALLHYKKFKSIPIILTAIYFCDSALPIVTALGVILFYFYSRYFNTGNLLPFLLTTVFGVIAYFTGVNGLDNQRFHIWETALNLDFNWLIGGGLGFFADNYLRQHVKHEHNEFLAVFMTYGFIGVGTLFFMIRRAVRASSPAITAGLFGVFVNSYGNFPFHVSVLALVAVCYYVICLKESIEEKICQENGTERL